MCYMVRMEDLGDSNNVSTSSDIICVRVLVPDRQRSDWRRGSKFDRRGMDKECQQLLRSKCEEFQKMINLSLGSWI